MREVCKAWKECAEKKIAIRESHYKAQLLTVNIFQYDRCISNSSWTDVTLKKNSNAYKAFCDWKKRWTSIPRTGICVSNCCYESQYLCKDIDNVLRQWLPDSAKLLLIPSIHPPPNIDPDVNWRKETDGTVCNFLSLPENSEQFSVEFLYSHGPGRDEMDSFNNRLKLQVVDPHTKLILVFHYISYIGADPIDGHIFPLAIKEGVVVMDCSLPQRFVYNPGYTYTIGKSYRDPETVVLLFKGNNLRVSSLVIDESVNSSGRLQQELERLKKTVSDYCKDCVDKCAGRNKSGYCDRCSSQMITIMVDGHCRANARHWYRLEGEDFDLRTVSFRRMIPNVPILGTSGYVDAGMSMNLFGEKNPIPSRKVFRPFDCTMFTILRFQ